MKIDGKLEFWLIVVILVASLAAVGIVIYMGVR